MIKIKTFGKIVGSLIIDSPVVVKPDALSKKLFTNSANELLPVFKRIDVNIWDGAKKTQ